MLKHWHALHLEGICGDAIATMFHRFKPSPSLKKVYRLNVYNYCGIIMFPIGVFKAECESAIHFHWIKSKCDFQILPFFLVYNFLAHEAMKYHFQ